MREAVSEVLASRAKEADGLARMVLYSFVAHAVLVAAIALVPREWLRSSAADTATPVMISLGGPPGQDTGGQTPIAARRVQEVGPTVQERFTPPPASRTPEMIAPDPPAPKPEPRTRERAAPRTNTRKPVTGEEVRSGAARVETRGSPVPFGGLAQSGGTGLNAQVGLDNFCCPDYLQTMIQSIRRNWNQDQGVSGRTIVRYTITREGAITDIEVMQSSGNFLLDQESRRAVAKTATLPPLPDRYTGRQLTIRLIFEYQR